MYTYTIPTYVCYICVYVKLNLLFYVYSITAEISSKISSFFGGGSSEEDATSTPPQGEATGKEQAAGESTTDQSTPEDDKQGLNEPIAIYYLRTYIHMCNLTIYMEKLPCLKITCILMPMIISYF